MNSDNPYGEQQNPTQENPYASPSVRPEFQQYPAPPQLLKVGIWRDGPYVLASNGAEFPDRCVKCNAPADGYRLKKNYSWHHPAIYLTILAGVLVYVIIALIVRKQARFNVGLCPRHRKRRMIWTTLFSLLLLGSTTMFCSGCLLSERFTENAKLLLVVGGLLLFLFSLIGLTMTTSLLRPMKIDTNYSWLKGAGLDFLETIPPR